ncbi:MAG: DegV family protein, partial [Lawsonibacter sp.]
MNSMSFKIVVDSCCDLNPQMMKDPVFTRVPLTIRSNGSIFVDDYTLDQADLL